MILYDGFSYLIFSDFSQSFNYSLIAMIFILYRRANLLIPGFGKLKHTFKASVEEFFSPKLLPVLSFSFLLVALSLAVTGGLQS